MVNGMFWVGNVPCLCPGTFLSPLMTLLLGPGSKKVDKNKKPGRVSLLSHLLHLEVRNTIFHFSLTGEPQEAVVSIDNGKTIPSFAAESLSLDLDLLQISAPYATLPPTHGFLQPPSQWLPNMAVS